MLSIRDVQDIAYLYFLDTSETHQEWVKHVFDYQPGDEVMVPNPWYNMGVGEKYTNGVVLDYVPCLNAPHNVKVKTDPGTMMATYIAIRVTDMKYAGYETQDKMFFSKRVHDIALTVMLDDNEIDCDFVIKKEIERSPVFMRSDLTDFFRMIEYDSLDCVVRNFENSID